MNRDLVSIILPAHNAAQTIQEAIESVLQQDYLQWQLIIIENGSSDNTLTICHQFKDTRILIIQETTQGLSKARNLGIAKAQGEFICFLDADDVLPPLSLSSRVRFFREKPEMAYCDGVVIKKNENLNRIIEIWSPQIPRQLTVEMNKINAICFCGVTWMIRSIQIGNTRFDESWSHLEDRKFFFELAQKGEYGAVSHPIYIIRKRNGSLMTNHRKLQAAYRRFLNFIKVQHQIDPSEFKRQHTFYRTMFFKTHLKTGRLLAAVHVLFERP